ncbi:unnamed protein product [marine sediment metagenome]|uniref:Uncharacterized protein n=1 Tax=marine sediment metagenome TaxID=412755 RepID=X1UMZ0_9ZZZZ
MKQMSSKMIHAGIGLLAAGAVGIIFAVVMEITTNEPVYFVVMKITALLFGVGGSLIGIASLTRKR